MSMDEAMRRFTAEPIATTRRPPLGGVAAIGTRRAYALAALSGVLYAVGFPPLWWSAAAWVALVPLLVACAALTPGRAALAGLCFTATAALGVAGFVPHMLASYFGLGRVASWAATLAIVAVLNGTFVAAFAAWVAWLARRRAAHPLLLAAGWLAGELARTSGTLGSGWALLAYSQLGDLRLLQSADLFGAYGIGLLIAAVNACVASVFAPALRGQRPRRSALAVVACLAAAFLYGERQLGATFDAGPAVRVAVVQGGAVPADAARRAAHLARYVDLTRDGAAPHTQLVVWPESSVAAYLEEPSPTRRAVLELAATRHLDLLLGGPHYESTPRGTRYHNSAYLVRDGRLAARYDKHRLVPFAEDGRWASPASDATFYTPGRGGFVLPGSALRIGTALCVESMSPEFARQAVREGAEVLANLSNDTWFADAAAARQQLASATLRAIENRRYLIRAAATGISAVIDPAGRTLAAGGFGTTHVLNAIVRPVRTRTPYQRWGDHLAWLVAAAAVLATLRARRRMTSPHAGGGRMSRSTLVLALTVALAAGVAGTARAGAPQPETRQGDYVHVCQGGPNKGLTCSVASEPVDCPNSACVVQARSKSIKGVLTLIAHDAVTDWLTGAATNRAVTALLEVKAPDGSKQLLAATYQDLADPTLPPSAPSDVIAIQMDEQALVTLAKAPGGLRFARPEASFAAQLQALFGNDGTPVLIDADERRPQAADHTADGLATVLRFKVRIMFVDPA